MLMSLINLDDHREETERALKAAKDLRELALRMPQQDKIDEYKTALASLRDALQLTTKYQNSLHRGQPRSDDEESKLSQAWLDASQKFYAAGDQQAWKLCEVKGWGWADERVWSLPEYINLPIQLDQMIAKYIGGLANAQNYEEFVREYTKLRRESRFRLSEQ
jgi:hypothetical protein